MKSTPHIETFEPITSFPDDVFCWTISDGKAGNDALCAGVSQALGLKSQIKRVDPRGLSRMLAPYGGVAKSEKFGEQGSLFSPPWPNVAIACGRLTTPYIRALRRAGGLKTYTVILLDPKTNANTADLFWVPAHDKRRGANVITTLTSPHRFSPDRLVELRRSMRPEIACLPSPRIAVLIGGPNGDYKYTIEDRARLVALMSDLARLPVGLMITCSRRTPPDLAAAIERTTRSGQHFFWHSGDGENPYPEFLAHADCFFVTADSVNMIGEACTTGKPVQIFFPGGGSAKFDRFHRSLAAHGATRPIVSAEQILDVWTYESLYSAPAIAAEIKRRYLRRRAVLGNMM